MDDSTAGRLVAKLRSLDLDDAEAALLATVFQRAAEAGGPEVEGFGAPAVRDPFSSTFGMDATSHTKPFKGSDEELQAIIDWLGSLEAQK